MDKKPQTAEKCSLRLTGCKQRLFRFKRDFILFQESPSYFIAAVSPFLTPNMPQHDWTGYCPFHHFHTSCKRCFFSPSNSFLWFHTCPAPLTHGSNTELRAWNSSIFLHLLCIVLDILTEVTICTTCIFKRSICTLATRKWSFWLICGRVGQNLHSCYQCHTDSSQFYF